MGECSKLQPSLVVSVLDLNHSVFFDLGSMKLFSIVYLALLAVAIGGFAVPSTGNAVATQISSHYANTSIGVSHQTHANEAACLTCNKAQHNCSTCATHCPNLSASSYEPAPFLVQHTPARLAVTDPPSTLPSRLLRPPRIN